MLFVYISLTSNAPLSRWVFILCICLAFLSFLFWLNIHLVVFLKLEIELKAMYKRKKKEGEFKLSIFYGRELLFSRNCHPKKSILGNFFPNKHFFWLVFFTTRFGRLLIVLHHAENNFAGFMNCREQK